MTDSSPALLTRDLAERYGGNDVLRGVDVETSAGVRNFPGATRDVQLGPLGGSRPGSVAPILWAMVFLGLVGAAALALYRRRDL